MSKQQTHRRFFPRDYVPHLAAHISTQQLETDLADLSIGITQIESRLKHSPPDNDTDPKWRQSASTALDAFRQCRDLVQSELSRRDGTVQQKFEKLVDLLKMYDFSANPEVLALLKPGSPAQ